MKSWCINGVQVFLFWTRIVLFLFFDLLRHVHNLNDICIIQYNSITTALFRYLKLLSMAMTAVEKILYPCMPVCFFQLVLFSKKLY